MTDLHKVMSIVGKTSMGSFDRINEMKDLPADMILLLYIKEAVKLNEDDVKLPARSKPKDNQTCQSKDRIRSGTNMQEDRMQRPTTEWAVGIWSIHSLTEGLS